MNEKLSIIPLKDIQPSEEVDLNCNKMEIYKICLQLKQLCEKKNGVGLSASQVGIFKKIFVIKFSDKYHYFVNCDYNFVRDEKILSLEGCLSLYNSDGSLKSFELERYPEVEISGYELYDNKELEYQPLKNYVVSGFLAVVFQHEIDHNFGRDKMIDKIGKEISIRGRR